MWKDLVSIIFIGIGVLAITFFAILSLEMYLTIGTVDFAVLSVPLAMTILAFGSIRFILRDD